MPITNPIRQEYQPTFDPSTDEWVLRVPKSSIKALDDAHSEIRLPLYLTRTYLSLGGAILRPLQRQYRQWLLDRQDNRCAICGDGDEPGLGEWTLDHQPPLSQPGSSYIDYEGVTQNRVIHTICDASQNSRS